MSGEDRQFTGLGLEVSTHERLVRHSKNCELTDEGATRRGFEQRGGLLF